MIAAFLLSTAGRYTLIAVAGSILIGGFVVKIRHDGYKAAIEETARQNQKAKEDAEAAGDTVDDCYARGIDWVWSVSARKCLRR